MKQQKKDKKQFDFVLWMLKAPGLKRLQPVYLRHKEVVNYYFYGILTSVVALGTFAVFDYVILVPFQLGAALSAQISNVVCWIVTVIFAFVVNKVFVFKATSTKFKDIMIEFLWFLNIRVFSLALELGITQIMVGELHVNSMVNKVFTAIIVVITNYVLSKKLFHKKKSDDDGEKHE